MPKTKAAYPDLARFIDLVIERSGKTAIAIAKGWGSDRSADVTDIKKGNPGWRSLDRFAKGVGFRGGALEMFTSGGDLQTAALLRAWKALPDDQARTDALRAVKQVLADDGAPTAT